MIQTWGLTSYEVVGPGLEYIERSTVFTRWEYAVETLRLAEVNKSNTSWRNL